jgi:hypothetical protein
MTDDRGIYCPEDGTRVPLFGDGWVTLYGPCPECGTYYRYDGDNGVYTVLDEEDAKRELLGD